MHKLRVICYTISIMKNLNCQQKIALFSSAAGVGVMESEGPLGRYFDFASTDDLFGAKTWESAESEMVSSVLDCVLKKAALSSEKLDFVLGGDLLNQCTASSFGSMPHNAPFLGLYGACSTFAEGLLLGASLIESRFCNLGAVLASSHFSSAERQYRFPLEYGCQRPPTSQRTVTGCGAALLKRTDSLASTDQLLISGGRIGVIIDSKIKDANHMGAVMAPAAADTLSLYLKESGESVSDFDMILTGDLGTIGAELFCELCMEKGIKLGKQYLDCGTTVFSPSQDVHAGASGCACSAVYLCGYLKKVWNQIPVQRLLLIGTGALLSPLTVQQKLSIPGIAHLVKMERG